MGFPQAGGLKRSVMAWFGDPGSWCDLALANDDPGDERLDDPDGFSVRVPGFAGCPEKREIRMVVGQARPGGPGWPFGSNLW